jgi:hypothetical protein
MARDDTKAATDQDLQTSPSQGHFRVVGCGAFGLDVDRVLGGEAEEPALFLPVMRQVLDQPQEPRRRELDWLTALKEGAFSQASARPVG